jgi:ferritin
MNPDLLEELRRHARKEMANAIAYLGLYTAALAGGYKGMAKVFRESAESEMLHAAAWAVRIAQEDAFLGGDVVAPMYSAGAHEVLVLADSAVGLEEETTGSMREVLAAANDAGDDALAAWVGEQIVYQAADEKEARDFAARVKTAFGSGCITLFDMELAK